ncbi:hypothetical protein AAFF_G00065050 [Aldrovandia affinis]|uniref:Uncharacterized protein n=1 Tax=Aldrovandia affinis TaxID=143900 RepID=A0AAD7WYJ0_9TELE|nr:hypothetical protein AAFF_G00065050 [Aldrovandia affinis]
METSHTCKRKREDRVSPGKDDITPDDRHVAIAMNGNILCAPVKRSRCLRYRKQKIESSGHGGGTLQTADCFQLLGVTSLLIASKQVEVFSPRITQLLALCCDAFTRDQLCNLERIVLARLSFQLASPTLAFFLHHFIQRGLAQCGYEHGAQGQGGHGPSDTVSHAARCWSLARRICELSLADYAFNRYRPSTMALCAVSLADQILGGAPGGEDEMGQGEEEEEGHTQTQDCARNLRLLVSLNQEVLHTMAEL